MSDSQDISKSAKKPFDRKKWRNQKYNQKFKKQQYEEKRSKAIMRHHFKQIKKGIVDSENTKYVKSRWGHSGYGADQQDEICQSDDATEDANVEDVAPIQKGFPTVKKLNAYQLAELEFQRKKEEKNVQKLQAVQKREEIKEALSKYNESKKKKIGIIRKKTKKGQPIMKERIEMLYEKIKKTCEKC